MVRSTTVQDASDVLLARTRLGIDGPVPYLMAAVPPPQHLAGPAPEAPAGLFAQDEDEADVDDDDLDDEDDDDDDEDDDEEGDDEDDEDATEVDEDE